MAQDGTNLLHIFDDVCKVGGQEITLSDVQLIRRYDLADRDPRKDDHDYAYTPSVTVNHLTEFTRDAISYIAGSVGNQELVQNLLRCPRISPTYGPQCFPDEQGQRGPVQAHPECDQHLSGNRNQI